MFALRVRSWSRSQVDESRRGLIEMRVLLKDMANAMEVRAVQVSYVDGKSTGYRHRPAGWS